VPQRNGIGENCHSGIGGQELAKGHPFTPCSNFKSGNDTVMASERLSTEELGQLAKQMVEATDPAEVARLEELIIRGFYG